MPARLLPTGAVAVPRWYAKKGGPSGPPFFQAHWSFDHILISVGGRAASPEGILAIWKVSGTGYWPSTK